MKKYIVFAACLMIAGLVMIYVNNVIAAKIAAFDEVVSVYGEGDNPKDFLRYFRSLTEKNRADIIKNKNFMEMLFSPVLDKAHVLEYRNILQAFLTEPLSNIRDFAEDDLHNLILKNLKEEQEDYGYLLSFLIQGTEDQKALGSEVIEATDNKYLSAFMVEITADVFDVEGEFDTLSDAAQKKIVGAVNKNPDDKKVFLRIVKMTEERFNQILGEMPQQSSNGKNVNNLAQALASIT